MRQVQEKRPVGVLFDELESPLGVALRQQVAVHGCLDHPLVFHERQRRPGSSEASRPATQVLGHVIAVGDAEVRIEPLPSRKELRLVTQVPFANDRSRVSALSEQFGDRDLVRMQSVRRDRPQHVLVARVVVQADPLRVATSQETRAGGRADARCRVEMGQLATLAGHPVEVRCAVQLRAERLGVPITEVVAENDDEVRRR